MYILAIDTASGKESCALLKKGNVIAFSIGNEEKLQAEKLFGHINKVLKEGDIGFGDIDYFAANLGPGSFTGIRIGLAALLAISYAAEKEFVGISSLEALAYKLAQENGLEKIYTAIDAGRGQAYYQEFRFAGNGLEVLSTAEMVDKGKILIADGGNIDECKIKIMPDARDIGKTAQYLIKTKNADFTRKSPIYIRKPDAKVNTNYNVNNV